MIRFSKKNWGGNDASPFRPHCGDDTPLGRGIRCDILDQHVATAGPIVTLATASGHCGFSEATFAVMRGNDGVAP